jgi:hypothetical protein
METSIWHVILFLNTKILPQYGYTQNLQVMVIVMKNERGLIEPYQPPYDKALKSMW